MPRCVPTEVKFAIEELSGKPDLEVRYLRCTPGIVASGD